jgi:hypothetical protein
MRERMAMAFIVAVLAVGAAGCGMTTQGATPDGMSGAKAGPPAPSAFEAWSARNGTGGFFYAVGPARGTGVRTGWPE